MLLAINNQFWDRFKTSNDIALCVVSLLSVQEYKMLIFIALFTLPFFIMDDLNFMYKNEINLYWGYKQKQNKNKCIWKCKFFKYVLNKGWLKTIICIGYGRKMCNYYWYNVLREYSSSTSSPFAMYILSHYQLSLWIACACNP